MTYQEPYPMGGTESDSTDYPGAKVGLTPEWLMEWEKERADKMVILRRQIQAKRDYIFAESMYGRPEHRKELRAMVSAYDTVLNLVNEVLK